MRSLIITVCLILFASTPALAGGGFFSRALDRAAIRQGRRAGLRDAARVQAFSANVYAPVRAVRVQKFVQPVVVRQRFVAPVYSVPVRSFRVQSFAAPSYGFRSVRSLRGCR